MQQLESQSILEQKPEAGISNLRGSGCCSRFSGFIGDCQMTSTKIIVSCLICSKDIKTTEKRQRLGRGKYCSRKCLHASQVKLCSIVCIVCGRKKTLTARQYGVRDGRFCSSTCFGLYNSGTRHPQWRGGLYLKGNTGYFMKYDDATRKHFRLDRLLVEGNLGRKLTMEEIVHHKNEIKSDNSIENLEIVTRAEHIRIHDPRNWKHRQETT